ncbi:hypothetical protein [Aquimarina sp. 2201CG14-23]|uniref:hypothetical protein n=1 Tax=Aquimarina mycalae TaxID=3040073 RepID=UPI0024781682|nr:hypothetical protein [Aquimarina sp. 2201CG14-23]MDH7447119.1 hypothetical protein [Aquimarina sp. 2201CG14-23]
MRTTKFILLSFAFLFIQSCCPFLADCDNNDDDIIIDPISSRYEPVFIDRNDFENSVSINDPIAINTSGKIYIKDGLLFINEVRKGFHIYDNTDPTSPTPIKFLKAPGSTDLAVRDNMIYINQATDLIAIAFNTATNEITLTKRVVNVFPELRSPDGFLPYNIPENNVVVGWELTN